MSRQRSLTGRAALLIVVGAVLAVTLAIPVRAWMSQRAEIAALESDVAAARQRVDALTQQRDDWNDPAYVIAQARSRLHFVFPGEVGYVVLGEDDRPVTAPVEQQGPVEPWFSALWDSTRQADRADAPQGSPVTP